MSMYYSPELAKILMAERIREAREANRLHCCQEAEGDSAGRWIGGQVRNLFSRHSPASCNC